MALTQKHLKSAAAWAAAWVAVSNGYEFLGPRELLQRPEWAAEIRWRDFDGGHLTTHRPDLIAISQDGLYRVAIEIQLNRTTPQRIQASLHQHAIWHHRQQSDTVLYICADQRGLQQVRKHAAAVGLSERDDTLILMLLDAMKQATVNAFEQQRADRARPLA